jgi:hypothetical protein
MEKSDILTIKKEIIRIDNKGRRLFYVFRRNREAIESGFEYVTEVDGVKLFRKRK